MVCTQMKEEVEEVAWPFLQEEVVLLVCLVAVVPLLMRKVVLSLLEQEEAGEAVWLFLVEAEVELRVQKEVQGLKVEVLVEAAWLFLPEVAVKLHQDVELGHKHPQHLAEVSPLALEEAQVMWELVQTKKMMMVR